jgi:hypothetical protein
MIGPGVDAFAAYVYASAKSADHDGSSDQKGCARGATEH